MGEKLVYWQVYDDWKWIICSGTFVGEMEIAAAAEKKELEINLIVKIVYICVFAILITLAAIRFSYVFSKKVKTELDLLLKYFKESARGQGKLSERDCYFDEFRFIAGSAIAMVANIQSLISKIKKWLSKLKSTIK